MAQHPCSLRHILGSRSLSTWSFSLGSLSASIFQAAFLFAPDGLQQFPIFLLWSFYLLFQSKQFLRFLPDSILYHILSFFRHNILLDPGWHVSTCLVESIPSTDSFFDVKSTTGPLWHHCLSSLLHKVPPLQPPGRTVLRPPLEYTFWYILLFGISFKWVVCLCANPTSLPGWLLQFCTSACAKKHILKC